tara:strand:+ start:391 stop:564 length:174 start_codon:yes stop_codon:yes gene_type:complete
MIEFFLSASLSCPQAHDIISRMEKQRERMSSQVINELIHEVKLYVPECFNDEGSVHD